MLQGAWPQPDEEEVELVNPPGRVPTARRDRVMDTVEALLSPQTPGETPTVYGPDRNLDGLGARSGINAGGGAGEYGTEPDQERPVPAPPMGLGVGEGDRGYAHGGGLSASAIRPSHERRKVQQDPERWAQQERRRQSFRYGRPG
jgi:hypothetical protein